MASAAPSAAVAPAAGQGEGAQVGTGEQSEQGQQEQKQAGTRADGHAIKPIKESLPGVLDVTEGDEALAELTGESERRRAAEDGVVRDSRGRFVKADGDAGTAPRQDAAVPPKPGEEPQKPKYKFAGEEWETAEKAEQSFRTLRGQYKALDARAKQFDEAAASARGWHAEAQRMKAELEALRGSSAGKADAASPATTEPGADTQQAGESIDWAMYAEVKKAAAEQGQPDLAEVWLAKEQERVIQTRIEKLLEERLAPVREAEQNAYLEQHVSALWDSLGEYVNEDGSPAFPELLDEAEAAEVGRLWHSMGLPPEVALTPQGAVAAVRMYRGSKAQTSAVASATPAPAPSSVLAVPASPARASDAETVIEHGGDIEDGTQETYGQSSPEAQRIVAAMRRSGAHLHVPGLGFER